MGEQPRVVGAALVVQVAIVVLTSARPIHARTVTIEA
jgi:hypothetical protein